jgi:hypothetical protein
MGREGKRGEGGRDGWMGAREEERVKKRRKESY